MQLKFLIFTTIFILLTPIPLSSSQPNHYLKPSNHLEPSPTPSDPKESIEITPPVPTSKLPLPPPECTLLVLNYSFANTMGQPPVTVPYSSPLDCPPPWSHVTLQLNGAVSGVQYDRIGSLWLGGAEILRTSTPEPSDNGTFWNVRKDITRYTSLLQESDISLSMILENLVNDVYTGVYDIDVTFLFYKDEVAVRDYENRRLGLGFKGLSTGEVDEQPADLVIPLVEGGNQGFWLRIEDESTVASNNVVIPVNANKVVLELYVSHHGDDEFWYSNPPDRYIIANNLTLTRGNGAFREVLVRVDGNVVASEVPFPVVFTGGINPLFWEPVVAIGAFDLPSYDFDLTPFLGSLNDGLPHRFELGVAHAIPFWLVGANVHVWLDKGLPKVEAQTSFYVAPEFSESWVYNFYLLDGLFEVQAERKSVSSGWVASSCGNFTTSITKKIKLKNSITFQGNGTYKIVNQKVKVKTEVKVLSETGSTISKKKLKREYPLLLITSTEPGVETDTYLMKTNISQAFVEKAKSKSTNAKLKSKINNSQDSGGWMLVKDHLVLSGTAETRQTLDYQDNYGSFVRRVEATDGHLVSDSLTSIYSSIFHKVLNMMFGNW